ncbi:hypothetical protein BHE74_00017333 [Ensete ventricosum]|nr:hypothetical protein GW17_00052197 [Ensete ventricosum]RWW74716.1 hypothetical protein BHE74_00017333 [Ensete ventricosum]
MARWEKDEGGAKEERIVVSVRMRPLNATEMEKSDPSDWDCINDTTIVFKNSLPDRSVYPTAYTFGTVVEKLTEETPRDQWHLRELLSTCAGVVVDQTSARTPFTISRSLIHHVFFCSTATGRRDIAERDELSIASDTATGLASVMIRLF